MNDPFVTDGAQEPARFGHADPTQAVYPTKLHAMRRAELFKLACDRGLLKEDHPTPSKDSLIVVIENNVAVRNPSKLGTVEAPVPLTQAHKEVSRKDEVSRVVTPESLKDDDVFAVGDKPTYTSEETALARKLYRFYETSSAPLSMRKKFFEDFPHVDNSTIPVVGVTKAEMLEHVKRQLPML